MPISPSELELLSVANEAAYHEKIWAALFPSPRIQYTQEDGTVAEVPFISTPAYVANGAEEPIVTNIQLSSTPFVANGAAAQALASRVDNVLELYNRNVFSRETVIAILTDNTEKPDSSPAVSDVELLVSGSGPFGKIRFDKC